MQSGRKIAALLFCLSLLFCTPVQAQIENRRGECVVLLHGLFRSALAMKPLQWHLDKLGYTTVNESYPSMSYPIEELAEMAVGTGVEVCHSLGVHRIHFVTHSLGGILIRQYTSERELAGLERVVMLGPPNQGSQVADFVVSLELFDYLEPDAIAQLGTGGESVPRRLGPPEFELGVVAGTFRQGTMLPGFPDSLSDGTVAVAETIVPGMVDFLQMPVSHTFMIWNPEVMEQVAYFLEQGAFHRDG